MARLFLRLALACLVSMTLVLEATAASRVWVMLAEEGGVHAEAAAALKAELALPLEVSVAGWRAQFDGKTDMPDLIVTVGVAALDGTLERLAKKDAAWARIPVLAILLPQAVFDSRLAASGVGRRPFSAVVLDQPIGRQMALIRRALPNMRHVGVLPGPQTRPQLRQLASEAGARKLELVVSAHEVRTQEEIFPALKAVLEEADLILALPDPLVFNASTLQNILLTAYRARAPLVAFSPAYVKAGAVMAIYSTPTQVARRAAEMVRVWQGGRGLPAPQPSREFAVVTNAKVAASLGLALDDAEEIAADLRRQEGGR